MRTRLLKLGGMFYAAKCYWPGVTEADVRRVTEKAQTAARGGDVAYVGSLLFPDDALVLCLFRAASPLTVHTVSTRAGIPCERVMDSVWLARSEPERSALCAGSG